MRDVLVFPLKEKRPDVVAHTLIPAPRRQRQGDLCMFKSGLYQQCYTEKPCLKKTENTLIWGRKDGSVVKSKVSSSRGPGFNSQHPHGSSQLSVTPVPGNLTSSHRHTHRQNTSVHKMKISCRAWWRTPLIPALRRQRQADF